ncbi:MAG TPA: hypothetical protein VGR35_10725 [Tepidisphaeraceae bacterium]|nr:hypothetical protein [Tepidisphaeraceae bacterium]
MRITLNRFTGRLLLLALLPIVLPIRLWKWLTGRGRPPTYTNTIEVDPLAYDGPRPLVVSIWASYATVWKVATEKVIEQLRDEFAGKCEFMYIDGSRAASVDPRFNVDVLPAVLVFHEGREAGRFVNLLDPEEPRKLLGGLAGA